MKKIKPLLWYLIASGIVLIVLLYIQYHYAELLTLETRWLAITALPIIIGIFLTERLKKVKAFGFELEVFPSERNIDTDTNEKLQYNLNLDDNKLPADYYFINHTSFLRPEKQTEFKSKTNVDRPHYDIRVIIDSYYCGALERIKYVQYYLHKNYPEPIQIRSKKSNKFCLKELANGEYVLTAKLYLKKIEKPIILERYITLWESGPKIEL